MDTEKKYGSDPEKELEGLHPALKKYRGRTGFEVTRSKLEQLADNFDMSSERIGKAKRTRTVKMWLSAAASVAILVAAGLVFLMNDPGDGTFSDEAIDNLVLLDYLLEEEALFPDEDLFYDYLGEAYLDIVEDEIDQYEEWLFEADEIIFY